MKTFLIISLTLLMSCGSKYFGSYGIYFDRSKEPVKHYNLYYLGASLVDIEADSIISRDTKGAFITEIPQSDSETIYYFLPTTDFDLPFIKFFVTAVDTNNRESFPSNHSRWFFLGTENVIPVMMRQSTREYYGF